MRMDKFSYSSAASCLYEGMRWKNKDGVVEVEREGRACIDASKTEMNVAYVKEELRPDPRYKDEEFKKKNRGQRIADYHNSQVGSYSRAIMNGDKKSQAIGLIATLPKHNPWVRHTKLTEEEFEYMRDHMIEVSHEKKVKNKKDEELEKRILEKLSKVEWTKEAKEEVDRFLLGVKDAWLEECGIREEDVLFWCIHWDESYPHIHVMALPTVEKTYERDVYSKHKNAPKLLHQKGEKSISYSLNRFYEGRYLDEAGKARYPFMESYHQNVIERMKKNKALSMEARETAGMLLTGETKGKGFLPKDFDRETRTKHVVAQRKVQCMEERLNDQRDEFVEREAEYKKQIEKLESDKVAMQEEFVEKQSSMQRRLDELKEEKKNAQAEAHACKNEVAKASETLEAVQNELTIAIAEKENAQAEALAAKSQVAEATQEVAKAKEELEQAKDLLEEKEIELSEKLQQITSLRELIKDLKAELASLVKEVALFVPNVVKSFIGAWKNAKTTTQMEKVDAAAQAEAIAGAKALTENLRTFGTRAEALLAEEEVVSGVKMATFERTDQKLGFAKKQIQKLAEATGQAEAFEDERVMALALQDWFNRSKYEEVLAHKSEVDASLYMKAPLRAERALEYALEKVEEMEGMELG